MKTKKRAKPKSRARRRALARTPEQETIFDRDARAALQGLLYDEPAGDEADDAAYTPVEEIVAQAFDFAEAMADARLERARRAKDAKP